AGIEATAGAAWVLRAGTLIYLAAMFLALRLPDQVDAPAAAPAPAEAAPTAGPAPAPEPNFPPNERGYYSRSPEGGPRAAPPRRPDRTVPYERPDPYERPGRGEPRSLPPGAGPAPADSFWTAEPDEAPEDARPAAGSRTPTGASRWRTLSNVGPVVGEAMRGNAVLRAFSGYMVFLLAFLLRTEHFGVSHNFALGALVAAAAFGALAAMAIGSLLRARAPQLILFSMLALAPIVTAACAWFFSLEAAIAVAFTAALAAGLAKLALDSIVQREIGEEIRSSAFAVSETLNQVSNVAGSVAGVLVSMLDNGQAALAIPAVGLTVALVALIARRRRRILAQRSGRRARGTSTAGS
ncbi:MAG TPA: hypothetical protein VIX15_08665, partial [Streptosporangiaceae bacterium]